MNENNVHLRSATLDDAAAIAEIHIASWRETYRGALSDDYLAHHVERDRKSLWQQRLTNPPKAQKVIVAEHDRALIGFSCLQTDADPLFGILLDNLHVVQGRKGRGIGRLLMQGSAQWCQENVPDQGLYLLVVITNARAIGFYQQLGGEIFENRIWETPDGGAVDCHVIGWTVADRNVANLAGEA